MKSKNEAAHKSKKLKPGVIIKTNNSERRWEVKEKEIIIKINKSWISKIKLNKQAEIKWNNN